MMAQRTYILERLAWRNSHNSAPAQLAAIRFAIINPRRNSVRQNAARNPTETGSAKSLKSLERAPVGPFPGIGLAASLHPFVIGRIGVVCTGRMAFA
jgi:hypothetical protein